MCRPTNLVPMDKFPVVHVHVYRKCLHQTDSDFVFFAHIIIDNLTDYILFFL